MGSSLGFYEGRKGDRQTPTASHSAMLVIDGASACQRPGDEDSHGANGGTDATESRSTSNRQTRCRRRPQSSRTEMRQTRYPTEEEDAHISRSQRIAASKRYRSDNVRPNYCFL